MTTSYEEKLNLAADEHYDKQLYSAKNCCEDCGHKYQACAAGVKFAFKAGARWALDNPNFESVYEKYWEREEKRNAYIEKLEAARSQQPDVSDLLSKLEALLSEDLSAEEDPYEYLKEGVYQTIAKWKIK